MNVWLNSINGWITIHFGINPKNGGSPPRENMFIIIIIFIPVDIDLLEIIWLKWNNLYVLNIIIIIAEINE